MLDTTEVETVGKRDVIRANLLVDFYGPLLTDHQREIWQLYFAEDWSLAEIGSMLGVSRAAVADVVDRTGALMTEYERKLGLIASAEMRQHKLAQLIREIVHVVGNQEDVLALRLARELAREEGLTDV